MQGEPSSALSSLLMSSLTRRAMLSGAGLDKAIVAGAVGCGHPEPSDAGATSVENDKATITAQTAQARPD
jgi:hypothetical protein